MSVDGSITRWIEGLRAGEKEAASQLWDRFFGRMKQLAKSKSRPTLTRGLYDEEDVALSAFASFCRALRAGNYPDLSGRAELWQLLATFTFRKARERAKAAHAQKRGGESANADPRPHAPGVPFELDELEARTLTPDLLALMNEQCIYLFGQLNDPQLEEVAAAKLEGYTNDEIAEQLGYTRRTIQRMLALIRRIWTAASPS